MKRLTLQVAWAISVSFVALFAACISDNKAETTVVQAVLGKRGESCNARADCEQGLACVNHVCRTESLNLQPTGKACVTVQCSAPEDCCPPPSSICPTYKSYCDQGEQVYCTEYDSLCVCDTSQVSCENDKCVQTCTPADAGFSDSCRSLGQVCVGSRCVDCAQDSDCALQGLANRICADNKCQIKCTKDTDCAAFFRCDTGTSACVKSGCQSDRDCILTSSNPLSTCNQTTHDCEVPCQSDLEMLVRCKCRELAGVCQLALRGRGLRERRRVPSAAQYPAGQPSDGGLPRARDAVRRTARGGERGHLARALRFVDDGQRLRGNAR